MVYILILNWNDAENTINCIKSIETNVVESKKIIILDNNSEDDSLQKIIEYVDKTHNRLKHYTRAVILDLWHSKIPIEDTENMIIIKNDNNGGFAYGNNTGLMYSLLSKTCEYIWLLNVDTEINPKSLTEIIKLLKLKQNVGICGSILIDYYDRSLVQCYGGGNVFKYLGKTKLYLKNYPVECINNIKHKAPSFLMGASLCIRKECLKAIGMMDEKFFMYSEEIAWQHNIKKSYGWEIDVAPESIVYHKGSVSSGGRSANFYYMLNKSSIMFIKSAFGMPTTIIASINLIFISIIQNIKSYSKIKSSIRGVLDGLKANSKQTIDNETIKRS